MRQNLRYIEQPGIEYVLILSGDQLYRMDFREMMATHRETQGRRHDRRACRSIARRPRRMGIMRLDDDGRVVGFLEKPQTDKEMDIVRDGPGVDRCPRHRKPRAAIAWPAWASICSTASAGRAAREDRLPRFRQARFSRPPSASHSVQVHLFDGYWEDIGTIRSFYDANLGLARPIARSNWPTSRIPIYTRARFLPPSRIDGATDQQQPGRRRLHDRERHDDREQRHRPALPASARNVTIRNSILMGVDYYESAAEAPKSIAAGRPPLGIGEGSVIETAIIDKNAAIGRKVRIANDDRSRNLGGNARDDDRRRHRHHSKSAVLPDGWYVNVQPS